LIVLRYAHENAGLQILWFSSFFGKGKLAVDETKTLDYRLVIEIVDSGLKVGCKGSG
jgi:hypothetical protein